MNRGITGAMVARQPFGGNRRSGIGAKAGGPDYLLQFAEPRVVTENTMRHGPGGGVERLRAGISAASRGRTPSQWGVLSSMAGVAESLTALRRLMVASRSASMIRRASSGWDDYACRCSRFRSVGVLAHDSRMRRSSAVVSIEVLLA